MSQSNIHQLSNSQKNKLQPQNSSQPVKIQEDYLYEPKINHFDSQIPKNRRWDESEHMLYILFLEKNRQRIKSKLIRRSNSFFKDMSAFLSTKSPTQCRSYHQKYQIKYKFPHRIIRQQRQKVDSTLYTQLVEQFEEKQRKVEATKKANKASQNQIFIKRQAVQKHQFQCQTIIQGVSTIFYQQDSYGDSSNIQKNYYSHLGYYPSYPYMTSYYPFAYFSH